MCAAWVRHFVLFFVAWLALTVGGMVFFGLGSPLLFYLLGYGGFLLAVEFSSPDGDRPRNHRRLRWISMGGFVVFIYAMVSWVQSVIASMPA